MRGICFRGVKQVGLETLEDPCLESPGDAIVQVEWAGLCGSDLHPYFGREEGLDPGTVMGHEFVGQIVELGSAVRQRRLGERVFAPFSTNCGRCWYCLRGLTSRCQENQLFGWRHQGKGLHGGQAERVRVPWADATLKPLPAGMSARAALLLGDNYSTGYYCAEMAGIEPDGIYAVIGCGTVGLLAILAAKKLGARQIVAFDPVPERQRQAEALGAQAPLQERQGRELIARLSRGRGADAVLELVGLPAAQRLAYELIRPGGVLAVIGCHCTPGFAFSPVEAYDKNLTYRTGRCPARNYMDRLIDDVMTLGPTLESFITHEFELAECQRAYELFSNREQGCLKAVFRI